MRYEDVREYMISDFWREVSLQKKKEKGEKQRGGGDSAAYREKEQICSE